MLAAYTSMQSKLLSVLVIRVYACNQCCCQDQIKKALLTSMYFGCFAFNELWLDVHDVCNATAIENFANGAPDLARHIKLKGCSGLQVLTYVGAREGPIKGEIMVCVLIW